MVAYLQSPVEAIIEEKVEGLNMLLHQTLDRLARTDRQTDRNAQIERETTIIIHREMKCVERGKLGCVLLFPSKSGRLCAIRKSVLFERSVPSRLK